MESKNRQRDYLFDNYKVLLIILVIIGHFTEPSYRNNDFLYTLKWLIVSFHMPAFIFISGYFSKRELTFAKLFQKLVIPYLIYEFIYYFFYIYVLHKETSLYLLYPKFSLWYILALFAWRAVTPYFKKLPYYMLLSVGLGLLIGCSDMADNFLSLPRILVFYPFFLAGTIFSRDTLNTLRTRKCQLFSACVIATFILYLILDETHTEYSPKIFYGRYNYDFLGQTNAEGIFCRLFCYAVSFILTFAIFSLITDRQNLLSYIGSRTMAIYLFHGLTYSYLKECTTLLDHVDTLTESLILLFFCTALALLFSALPFSRLTGLVSNLPTVLKLSIQQLAFPFRFLPMHYLEVSNPALEPGTLQLFSCTLSTNRTD